MDNLLNSALKSSTASGSTITITDGADGIPIKSLIVELNNIALIDSLTINHTVGGVTTPYTIQFIDEQGGTILVQRPATLDVTNGTITTQSGTVKLQGGGLEIKTALGENTFSVQSADMTMVYRADTALYIEQNCKTYQHNLHIIFTDTSDPTMIFGDARLTLITNKPAPITKATLMNNATANVDYAVVGVGRAMTQINAISFDNTALATVTYYFGTTSTETLAIHSLTDEVG